MKIPVSIRDTYFKIRDDYEPLKERIDREIGTKRHSHWFYTSRLKELPSYAQKVETGRFDPQNVEDFFACTMVVRNLNDFDEALSLVRSVCDIQYSRPVNSTRTHKHSDSFPFDDLRLYLTYRDNPALKPSGLTTFVFEAQIKTFLQHAWSIATHDLIYKADNVSWAKSRIAFQIKAMLEHAEISIEEADLLSGTPQLAKSDERTDELLAVMALLSELWKKPELPEDVLRLADTVKSLIRELRISVSDLKRVMEAETKKGRGTKLVNLSPYSSIIQSLIDASPTLMKSLMGNTNRRFKVFIPKEVDIPVSFTAKDLVNTIRI